MTGRARALVAIALMGLGLGTARSQILLSLVSFCILLWIIIQGWRFRSWLRWEMPNLQVQRYINGRLEGETLWAGRRADMEVRISARKPARVNVRVRDYVPEQLEINPLGRSQRCVGLQRVDNSQA